MYLNLAFSRFRMKQTSVRRKSRKEILDAKVAAHTKAQALEEKLKTIDRLQQDLKDAQARQ